MRIYLTGFMGSGKSTIGPILANVVGYDFVDLDTLIEEHEGKPVQMIFAEEGEAVFRQREAEALQRTAARDRIVVALGGGALTQEENLHFALRHGTIVYLRVSITQLVQRLQKSPTERPLLQDAAGQPLSKAALGEKVAAIMKARTPYYEQAQVIVDVGSRDVGRTVDAVVKALRRQGRI